MEEIINGIAVQITRKNIKTLRLTVGKDGGVKVSAPKLLSSAKIRNFVTSHQDWIIEKQRVFFERQKEISDAAEIMLWGKKHPIVVKDGKKAVICRQDDTLVFINNINSKKDNFTFLLESFYKSELKDHIAARLPVLEELTGLKCCDWRIRKMVSRWGSCNIKTKVLCFSLNLAKHPFECLDYVIIHELLHISVPNHGSEFKSLLTRYCPNWKIIKKQLNG